MDVWIALLGLIGGYLIGSISFVRLVTRLVAPDTDLNNVELDTADGSKYKLSGYGATTASVKLGGKVGCAIGIMDVLKAFLPAVALRALYPDQPYFLLTAFGAVAGHIWPVFYQFKGGWGISPIYGGMFAIDPIGALVSALLGNGFGMLVVRDFLVAYLAGPWIMIFWLWIRTGNGLFVAWSIAVNVLFILALIPELRVYLRDKKSGKVDMRSSMASIPMGRGMQKIMDKLGLDKK